MSRNDWWQQVPDLIKKVDEKYAEAMAAGQTYTKLSITQKKMVEFRKWQPSLPIIQGNFDRVLSELECFYIPKTVPPGPMMVFPMRDIEGEATRAQTKPYEGSPEFGPKYTYLGLKSAEFRGPCWLGNDARTLRRMVAQRRVCLVEGSYDLAACRLIAPDVPALCPLTKSLGGGHQKYLRMFGVETIFLMFDNEKPKDDQHDIGGGELSMRALKRDIQEMKVEILYCPSSDPSKCLESYPKALQLKSLLLNL